MPCPSVVVTGAAGFIGSQIIKALATHYPLSHLLVVDHPIRELRIGKLPVGIRFLNHDEFHRSLESGGLKPSLIIHMGACSSTLETDWEYLRNNNLEYSKSLCGWCAKNDARFIYASSAATYGNGENGFDDSTPIELLKPMNLYAKSKHDFDLWIKDLAFKNQCVGLKFFNVFGPGESHKGTGASMVYHGIRQIRKSGMVTLFQTHRPGYRHGEQLRDFIYVKDVVRVILAIIARPEISGLFNLGTGTAHTFNELMDYTFRALGHRPSITYVPIPETLRNQYQYFTQATMTKLLKTGIDYRPTPLYDAILDYVDSNP